MSSDTVRVELGDRSHDILIGPGAINKLPARLKDLSDQQQVAIVTDTTIAELHLPAVTALLEAEGFTVHAVVIPAGEESKRLAVLEQIVEDLLEARVERDDVIVALGGGVVGDLTGFAASILRRGVRFVQVPTTLLAQVDSSVGGKTGINSPHGKNLIGAFHQPSLVIADIAYLDTLPPRELRAGYAEVVKYGLIDDPEFFEWLEVNGPALLAGDSEKRTRAVAISCRAKARIVAEDETEKGARALLNLGHTFGHALEADIGYSSRLLHGEGVGIGMMLAFDLSVRTGLCTGQDAGRIAAHLNACGMPVRIADIEGRVSGPDILLHHMKQDKKVARGRMTFILARGIGQSIITQDVDIEQVRALLADHTGA